MIICHRIFFNIKSLQFIYMLFYIYIYVVIYMLFLNFKSVLIKKSSYRHMFDIVEQYYSIYSIEIEDIES